MGSSLKGLQGGAGGMAVAVRQGQVIVDSVLAWIDDPRAKVLLVNLKTKRCQVESLGAVEDGVEVRLVKAEDSIDAAETEEATEILIGGLGPHWKVVADPSRYTVTLLVWELDPEKEGLARTLYERGAGEERGEP